MFLEALLRSIIIPVAATAVSILFEAGIIMLQGKRPGWDYAAWSLDDNGQIEPRFLLTLTRLKAMDDFISIRRLPELSVGDFAPVGLNLAVAAWVPTIAGLLGIPVVTSRTAIGLSAQILLTSVVAWAVGMRLHQLPGGLLERRYAWLSILTGITCLTISLV